MEFNKLVFGGLAIGCLAAAAGRKRPAAIRIAVAAVGIACFGDLDMRLTDSAGGLIALGWVTNLFQRGAASMQRLLVILDGTSAVRETLRTRPVATSVSTTSRRSTVTVSTGSGIHQNTRVSGTTKIADATRARRGLRRARRPPRCRPATRRRSTRCCSPGHP